MDYHFVAEDEFRRMIDAGELIEWAQVHGSYYGTPLRNVREARARGQFLLLDIDVQGARLIRGKVPGGRARLRPAARPARRWCSG